jgi:hypothetical protein
MLPFKEFTGVPDGIRSYFFAKKGKQRNRILVSI